MGLVGSAKVREGTSAARFVCCRTALLVVCLLGAAALSAVEAAKPPSSSPKSKPPPKPVASKPPPKPIVSKPPPKPIASKPPPKRINSKPAPQKPNAPLSPIDPSFCKPCITIYGYVGYNGQTAALSGQACMQVTSFIIANLTSTLRAVNATVLDLSADCNSGALIKVCDGDGYYFWRRGFTDDTGNVLARGWLSYLLTTPGLLKDSCGSRPAGTSMSFTSMFTDQLNANYCMTGNAYSGWFCSS